MEDSTPLLRDLSEEDLRFLALYKRQLQEDGGVQQEENSDEDLVRLREHVLRLWHTCLAEATVLYRCVRELHFLRTKVDRHPHYLEVLATLKADPHARYLDLGCCFGTDTRRVIVDGWKRDNVVASDVIPDFWNYGLQLYEDAATLKNTVYFGDVTSDDPSFVQLLAADGLFAHVWTGAVLHVLTEAKVEALLRSVFALLRPGGTYFGICGGASGQPTEWQPEYRNRGLAYLHTAQSLKDVLERVGFVEVTVHEQDRPPSPGAQEGTDEAAALRRLLAYVGKKPSA